MNVRELIATLKNIKDGDTEVRVADATANVGLTAVLLDGTVVTLVTASDLKESDVKDEGTGMRHLVGDLVTNSDHLDMLPMGTEVADNDDDVYEKYEDGWAWTHDAGGSPRFTSQDTWYDSSEVLKDHLPATVERVGA